MKTITLIATLLVAPAVYAEDTARTDTKTETTKPAKPAKLTATELQVLAHYHELNLKEIDIGKYAVKTSRAEGVKTYGKMLIDEHGKADKKILALAKQRGAKIPAEKPETEVEKQEKAESKAHMATLKKMKGAEFDTAFLTAMVSSHETELGKVDTMAAKVSDPEVLELVKAKKAMLQMHADHARELQKAMNTQASR